MFLKLPYNNGLKLTAPLPFAQWARSLARALDAPRIDEHQDD